jgi:hypothetical protein
VRVDFAAEHDRNPRRVGDVPQFGAQRIPITWTENAVTCAGSWDLVGRHVGLLGVL